MFTGIIECLGSIEKIEKDQSNVHFHVKSELAKELKIDQSVAHNGVCLTVVELHDDVHVVTAIHETLEKTNLNSLTIGSRINLERCTQIGSRLDGHIVQGHVDTTGRCVELEYQDGSHLFTFEYESNDQVTVEKGSITVNGVSLTVFNSKANQFTVAIIPYTLDNTCFKDIKIGSLVNLEFDIIGKYVAKLLAERS